MPGFDYNKQQQLARAVKDEAARLGFEACGISKAERLDEEAARLEQWLTEGRQGSMNWMENHFEKRVDPRRLVDGARSVVSILHNYYQPEAHGDAPDTGKISRYAWGDDYHRVMKDKLYLLFEWLDERVSGVAGRVFVDSAPVLDKAWAARSGLGWQGKHTNLLNRTMGSFFFIGEIIVDVPMAVDTRMEDHCGSCTRCIDACPTDAIYEPYAVDSNRCISYLTIEDRDRDVPEDMKPALDNWIFGCDICQDVCPWNKFRQPTGEPNYMPGPGIRETELREWVELDLESFRERFKNSPIERATYDGFVRNARAALKGAHQRKQDHVPDGALAGK